LSSKAAVAREGKGLNEHARKKQTEKKPMYVSPSMRRREDLRLPLKGKKKGISQRGQGSRRTAGREWSMPAERERGREGKNPLHLFFADKRSGRPAPRRGKKMVI